MKALKMKPDRNRTRWRRDVMKIESFHLYFLVLIVVCQSDIFGTLMYLENY